MLTLPAAAERLAVSPRTVRREIAAGRLAVVRIGRSIRICETDLEAWRKKMNKPTQLQVWEGDDFPIMAGDRSVVYVSLPSVVTEGLPPQLDGVDGIREMPLNFGPGVYFLCKGDEIVYIGQSQKLSMRVISHYGKKEFSRVLFFSCHPSDLDHVESKFIHDIQPRLNARRLNGSICAPLPKIK